MKIVDIVKNENPEIILKNVLGRIHEDGPIDPLQLEMLAYLKHFHPVVFEKSEASLMYLLGLFYKTGEPRDLISLAYSTFSNAIYEETKQRLTPIQATIRNRIISEKYYSFSAPTSTGKSYLFRELILEEKKDIVIVVPSRALIAEYMIAVRKIISNRKDILLLQFIDDVNKRHTTRRVFVVTPERASEVLRHTGKYDVSLFLYDEAQISEEPVRGITFDALVRRVEIGFPNAKKVFAHPFVENPEAQLKKHGLTSEGQSGMFKHNSVGKIYLTGNASSGSFEYFSPYIEGGHKKKNRLAADYDIVHSILKKNGSILIYISKQSIYDKKFVGEFGKYIDLCDVLDNPEAIKIIEKIESIIGSARRRSNMISLMKKGVVTHHGSMPLAIRYLIEEFTRKGFTKICFATSTLAQGINMPFDLVWISSLNFQGTEKGSTLDLKNLIGRAGRSTDVENNFEYGFVVAPHTKAFIQKLKDKSVLTEVSGLDLDTTFDSPEMKEFVEAVKNDTMDSQYNMPISKLQRLRSAEAMSWVEKFLNLAFGSDKEIITGDAYRAMPASVRREMKAAFRELFELSLGRKLNKGERQVLSTAINILFWQIQGKSFREILGLRYSFLTQRDKVRKLRRDYENREITLSEYGEKIALLKVDYSSIASRLPDSKLARPMPSRFKNDSIDDFNYDLLVYDTYDYLDKVIAFSLSDIYIAIFENYFMEYKDERADAMSKYFRFGTKDQIEIFLLRYGFSFEDIEWIKGLVQSIDENELIFKSDVYLLDEEKKVVIERYMA